MQVVATGNLKYLSADVRYQFPHAELIVTEAETYPVANTHPLLNLRIYQPVVPTEVYPLVLLLIDDGLLAGGVGIE